MILGVKFFKYLKSKIKIEFGIDFRFDLRIITTKARTFPLFPLFSVTDSGKNLKSPGLDHELIRVKDYSESRSRHF